MNRYETRYDEKIMKHYFYDTELKEMVKFDDVRNYLNQQDRQIKELKNQLAEKDKEIERLRNCVMTEEQVKQIMQEGMYETNKDEASSKDIFKQSSIVYPKIMIEDLQSGRNFEFGKNCHDRLVISEDGRSLSYYNLQCGDGSRFGDFRFYYDKPNKDEYGVNFYDADFYARMVENEFLF